jgi:hypothetical protein
MKNTLKNNHNNTHLLINQHQFNGPINSITIEISKECSIFSLYNLIQSLRERHNGEA